MGKTHLEQQELEQQIQAAETVVTVGATYQHYKGTDKLYTVLSIAINEADNVLTVIYQAQYGKRLTFLRPVTSWMEQVDWHGQTVPRFKKISSS